MRFRAICLFGLTLALSAQNPPVPRPANAPKPAPPAPSGPPKKPGSVDGTVINSATGLPLKKAAVSIRSASQGFSYAAVTDAGGHFQFPSVEPGAYSPTVAAQGFSYYRPAGAPAASPPSFISVGEDQRVTDVKLSLSPLGVISGKVVDDQGDPIANVQISPLRFDFSQGGKILRAFAGVSTDDRGEYRLFDLEPGRYLVRAVSNNSTVGAQVIRQGPPMGIETTYYPSVNDPAQGVRVPVTPGGEVTNMDFRLRRVPVYRIRGTVAGIPSAGNAVSVRVTKCEGAASSDQDTSRYVSVQSQGSFEAAGLAPGVYCINAERNDTGRIVGYALETVTLASQDLDDVRLTLAPVSDMTGRLEIEGQLRSPLNQFTIGLQTVEGPAWSAQGRGTNNGNVTLPNVPPGKYRVAANGIPPGAYLKSMEYGRDDVSTGFVNVAPGGGATLTLHLGTDGGQISGTVQDESGQPAARYQVLVAPEDRLANRMDLLRIGFTGPNGEFQMIGIAPGEYKIYAWQPMDNNAIQALEFRQQFGNRATSVTVHSNGNETVQLRAVPVLEVQKALDNL